MHTLRTNFILNTADSEAYVHLDGQQFPIGSIAAHEIVKMLKQDGDVLIHYYNRLNKQGEIIEKSYSFDRSHVEHFANARMADLKSLSISSEEFATALRNGGWHK
ncbi:MAG: hypothetical protein ACN2B6_12515 [Rickettsiales bacterium]